MKPKSQKLKVPISSGKKPTVYGYSFYFGRIGRWMLMLLALYTMLLTPLFWRGVGGEVFAQVANGTGAGNCLSFDGVNDYVKITTSAFKIQPLSIEAWINTSQSAGTIAYYSDNHAYYGWQFATSGDGKGFFRWVGTDGGGLAMVSSNTNVIDGKWHHIVATDDGTTLKMYVNGVLENSVASATPAWTATMYLYMGMARPEGDDPYFPFNLYNGKSDEVRIWNTARTETEIRDNMCKKLVGNESGLVGYWRFDEASGSTAYDASPNGNNGTLY